MRATYLLPFCCFLLTLVPGFASHALGAPKGLALRHGLTILHVSPKEATLQIDLGRLSSGRQFQTRLRFDPQGHLKGLSMGFSRTLTSGSSCNYCCVIRKSGAQPGRVDVWVLMPGWLDWRGILDGEWIRYISA